MVRHSNPIHLAKDPPPGQIQSITDNKDSTKTTTYTYDAWARLKTASNAQWGLSWVYDRYGNRTTQTLTAGSGPTNALTITPGTNRVVGASYDAAGNMTNDNVNTLTYDAENKAVTSVNTGVTTTSTYDGNGLRVKKAVQTATTTVYLFSGSKVIAEYENGAVPGSPTREYIYAGAQLVAKIEGTSTNYFHPDHLSARAITDSSGAVAGTRGHYPYGDGLTWYETGTTTKLKFTSYERDAGTNESGNDYAMARNYINRYGRFNSTDPLSGSIADPQSLNHFSYTVNDLVNLIDPLGLSWSCYVEWSRTISKLGEQIVSVGPWTLQIVFCWGTGSGGWLGGSDRGGNKADRGGFWDRLKKAANSVCSAVPDASTIGGGFDAGLFVTAGGSANVIANGRSGELSLAGTAAVSAGVISTDAYASIGIIPNAPANSATAGPSWDIALGGQRTGVALGPNNYQATFGASALPFTAAFQKTNTKILGTVPYLGYALQPGRAVCKLITGH